MGNFRSKNIPNNAKKSLISYFEKMFKDIYFLSINWLKHSPVLSEQGNQLAPILVRLLQLKKKMAASLVQCRFSQSKIYVCKKHRFIQFSQRFASKYIRDYRKIDDEEPIEDIRDVSRLPEKLKRKLKKNYWNSVPEPDYVPPYDQKGIRRYQRRMYAMYGDKYEINPATLWPTKDEIAKEKQRDTFFDIPLEESFERISLSKEEKAENLRKG